MRDFFEQQEQARRHTTLLILLFMAAVVLIIMAVYAAVAVGLLFVGDQGALRWQFWDMQRFLWVSAITAMIVAAGSGYRSWQLKQGGGAAVAEMVGGVAVPQATDDPLSRRLLNVVEEMAIASGLPVPRLYLLPQAGINAFAAGFSSSDAVIAVTNGAMEMLNRDELQAVVAHEFSHILNGDIALKMRLMGLLYGITLISDIGILMMTSRHSSHYASGRERGAHPAIALVGFLVFLVGTIGAVFADLIKRAVSRQREFLADAAAVQFTRNPAGLAGALKVIGGYKAGSRVNHLGSDAVSHFFFGNALKGRPGSQWWATHPPLTERIRRLDPSFQGAFEHVNAAVRGAVVLDEALSQLSDRLPRAVELEMVPPGTADEQAEPVSLAAGESLLEQIPLLLRQCARDPYTARAMVYALLLDLDKTIAARQLNLLEEQADPNVFRELLELREPIRALPSLLQIPLLELTLPALKQLSEEQYRRFRGCMQALIKASDSLSLFEYMLHRMVLRHLAPGFEQQASRKTHFDGISEIMDDVALILAMLIRHGAHSQPEALFDQLVGELLPWRTALKLTDYQADLKQLDYALTRVERATPMLRRQVLAVCLKAVRADGEVNPHEYELMRAISDALDAPLPPRVI